MIRIIPKGFVRLAIGWIKERWTRFTNQTTSIQTLETRQTFPTEHLDFTNPTIPIQNTNQFTNPICRTFPTENKQNKTAPFFAEKLLATALTDASTNLKELEAPKNVGILFRPMIFFGLSNPKKIEKRHINPKHILLMDEILHHLGWLKPYKSWDNRLPWWCRNLSVNSMLQLYKDFWKIFYFILGHIIGYPVYGMKSVFLGFSKIPYHGRIVYLPGFTLQFVVDCCGINQHMFFFEGLKILAWKTWMLRKKLAIHDGGSQRNPREPPKMGLSQMVVCLMVMFISWDSESVKNNHLTSRYTPQRSPIRLKKHPRLSHRWFWSHRFSLCAAITPGFGREDFPRWDAFHHPSKPCKSSPSSRV